MAGHSSITTTEKYLHIIDEDSAKYMEQYWKSVYRYEEPKKKIKKPETIVSIAGTAVPTLVQPQTNITIDTHKIDWNLDDALARAIAEVPIVIETKGKKV